MLEDAKKRTEEMVATYAGNNSFDFSIDGNSFLLKKDLNIIQGSTSKDAATCGVSEDQIKNRRDRIMENLVWKSLEDKCLPNLWKRDGCNCREVYQEEEEIAIGSGANASALPSANVLDILLRSSDVNVDELCPVNGALVGDGGLSLYSPIAWLSVASILTAYLWILRCICFYFSWINKFDEWGNCKKILWEVFQYIFLSLTANEILGPLGSVGTIGKTHIMVVKTMPGWGVIMLLATIISPCSLVLFILLWINWEEKSDVRHVLFWLILFITCIASMCLLPVVGLFFNNFPTFFLDLSFMFSIDFNLTFTVPAILVKWFLYILSIGDTVTTWMRIARYTKKVDNASGGQMRSTARVAGSGLISCFGRGGRDEPPQPQC